MEQKKDTLLGETPNGYVLKCSCCSKIQITFGNVVLKNDHEQFVTLKQCIDNIDIQSTCNNQLPGEKQFILPFPYDIAITFSKEEIIELRGLLDDAEATIKVERLLQEAGGMR